MCLPFPFNVRVIEQLAQHFIVCYGLRNTYVAAGLKYYLCSFEYPSDVHGLITVALPQLSLQRTFIRSQIS